MPALDIPICQQVLLFYHESSYLMNQDKQREKSLQVSGGFFENQKTASRGRAVKKF